MSGDPLPVTPGPEPKGRPPAPGRLTTTAELRRRRARRRIERIKGHRLNPVDPGLAQIQFREERVAKPCGFLKTPQAAQRAALDHGPMKQSLRGRHSHQRADLSAAARLSKHRDTARIPAET